MAAPTPLSHPYPVPLVDKTKGWTTGRTSITTASQQIRPEKTLL
jgi:hypothetical protein